MEIQRPAPAESETPLRNVLRPAGPPRFGFSVQPQADGVLVRIDGELDLLTAPKLAAQLNEVVRGCTTDVRLDMREVEFLDSAGLQILLATHRRLNRMSRRLEVICDPGPVRRVIEMARLDQMLGLEPDGADAAM